MRWRFISSLSVAALAGALGAQSFPFWPQGGNPGQDIELVNPFDHNTHTVPSETCSAESPPSCYSLSFRCDYCAVDGHSGSDALIPSFGEVGLGVQGTGVPLFAVADGTICDAIDQWDDDCIQGSSTGTSCSSTSPCCSPTCTTATRCTVCTSNHVHIDHGNGVFTFLRHMKKGSIPNKPDTNPARPWAAGDTVYAGEQIGETGSSGASKWPHVHFEVKTDGGSNCGGGITVCGQTGESVDPFGSPSGSCTPASSSLWVFSPTFSTSFRMWDVGVTNVDFITEGAGQVLAPQARPGGGWIYKQDNYVYVWGLAVYVPSGGVTVTYRVKNPSGTQVYSQNASLSESCLKSFEKKIDLSGLSHPLATGTWHLWLDFSNGAPSVDAPFQVTDTNAAPTNRAPKASTSVTLEPSSPTPSYPLYCRVVRPLVDDDDYDIVRYHYVWKNLGNNQTLRDKTHAGQSDALARNRLSTNMTIQCCVTPTDGKSPNGNGDTTCAQTTILDPFVPGEWVPIRPDLVAGAPTLFASGKLAAGTSVTLQTTNGTPEASAVWMLSSGAPGADGIGAVPVASFVTMLDRDGRGQLQIPIPDLLGSDERLYARVVVLDRGASGYSATRTLAGVIAR